MRGLKKALIGTSWSLALSLSVYAEELQRIPDELESQGGYALGLGNAGVAAITDLSSVRANPAMIAFDKQYTVSAGYHWPSLGREFYQAGAVDAKTAPVAAGLLYTGSTQLYRGLSPEEYSELGGEERQGREALDAFFDSPIEQRINVALGKAYQYFAIGANLGHVRGFVPNTLEEGILIPKRGTSFGLGIAGLLTKELRLAMSVENLGNRQFRDLAPGFARVGMAYVMFNGDLTLHLDAHRRERVSQEKDQSAILAEVRPVNDFEQFISPSASFRIQDLLRVVAAYGQENGGLKRQTISGGLAVVNEGFSFSYMVMKPYLSESEVHQGLNLSFQLAM